MVVIRQEPPADAFGVRKVNEEAFGRPDEVDLVQRLHRQGEVTISLVAEVGGEIVGHILFSPVPVVSGNREWGAVALGRWGCAQRPAGRDRVATSHCLLHYNSSGFTIQPDLFVHCSIN